MEMPEMMAAWLAETERIAKKEEPLTLTEEFLITLTLEFDTARNQDNRKNARYLNLLLQTVDMYLSGQPDEAMANFLSVIGYD